MTMFTRKTSIYGRLDLLVYITIDALKSRRRRRREEINWEWHSTHTTVTSLCPRMIDFVVCLFHCSHRVVETNARRSWMKDGQQASKPKLICKPKHRQHTIKLDNVLLQHGHMWIRNVLSVAAAATAAAAHQYALNIVHAIPNALVKLANCTSHSVHMHYTLRIANSGVYVCAASILPFHRVEQYCCMCCIHSLFLSPSPFWHIYMIRAAQTHIHTRALNFGDCQIAYMASIQAQYKSRSMRDGLPNKKVWEPQRHSNSDSES